MLHKDVALTHDDAVAFCKAEYGPSASLPSAAPAILAAAQSLVQQGQVSAGRQTGAPIFNCRPLALLLPWAICLVYSCMNTPVWQS